MLERSDICWFCGRTRDWDFLPKGESIGNMVYSSHLWVSAPHARSPQFDAGNSLHWQRDCARICDGCLDRFVDDCGPLDERYLVEQEANLEHTVQEMLSYETGLHELHEREYSFGCWFEDYPDVGVRKKYASLPLAELFHRGLRFEGHVELGEPETIAFLDRFETRLPGAENLFDEQFAAHISKALGLVDAAASKRFALVQARIFDVSVKKLIAHKQ